MDANGSSSGFTRMESPPESDRRQIVETRLSATAVEKYFGILADLAADLVAGPEFSMIDELIFY